MNVVEKLDRKSIYVKLNKFKEYFTGKILNDDVTLSIYSYDASVYRIEPIAVLYPRTSDDIRNCILFARNNKVPLIPRTAGTSLGGQCVGDALIIDFIEMNSILEVNEEEKYAIVHPGVVRDELNIELHKRGLHFGPNTSTSNRAMIGGMVGNNSSGTYSIKYGTTRENIISIKGYLSDGSEVEFSEIDEEGFRKKSHGTSLENAIYRQISFELSHPLNQEEIEKKFPKKSIKRRNTGYALDELLNSNVFKKSDDNFNFTKLLCGSEGTLMIFSEIKVKLVDNPINKIALICAHFDSIKKSLESVPKIMELNPNQCELMDKAILDCTDNNILQKKNRFFLKGRPEAILMIEVEGKNDDELNINIDKMTSMLSKEEYAYDFSVLFGEDIRKAMHLRASGLGVLQNIVGDDKSIEFVEDTAVDIGDLSNYIEEFDKMIKSLNTESVYYAHAGAGEIHIRPKINLQSIDGRMKFRKIAENSARLVAKYRGSLSGEHGDGIVRSEFIPEVLGEKNYEIIKRIKNTWDPLNILNPGKIVDPYQMDDNLQEEYLSERNIETIFDFQKEGGYVSALKKCSGSGDCRKTEIIGGTMCPSFHASRDEKLTTRARANALKDFFTHNKTKEIYNDNELYETMKLCLGCKACISECPSSVDMAAIKSEFLYQYYNKNKRPKLDKMVLDFEGINSKLSKITWIVNPIIKLPIINKIFRKIIGVDTRRSLPEYDYFDEKKYVRAEYKEKIYLYIDEFSRFYDAKIVRDTIELLDKMQISVIILPIKDSGRGAISRGMLELAKKQVNDLITTWSKYSNDNIKIVGIEPSAILGLKDDYFRLVIDDNIETLKKLSHKTMLIEEYIAMKFKENEGYRKLFTDEKSEVIYHGHCHQKSLLGTKYVLDILNFPKNYFTREINSGCCGMAGSFGYENYDISMKIGDLKLFPQIRNKDVNQLVAASGTSCRHQIKEGTSEDSFHPVQILKNALIRSS